MDDLLDLSWSDKPAPAPAQNRAPAALAGSSFDLLSRPAGGPSYYSPSTSVSRASTPLAPLSNQSNGTASAQPSSRAQTPLPASARATPPPAPAPGAPPSSSDAFSSLFSMSSGGPGAAGGKTMTMAERQAALAKERADKAERERQQFAGDAAFWERLGGGGSSPSAPTGAAAPPKQPAAPAVLAPVPAPASKPPQVLRPTSAGTASRPASAAAGVAGSAAKKPAAAGSFWENEFLAPSATKSPAARSPSPATPATISAAQADPWDLDALDTAVPGLVAPRRTAQAGNDSLDTDEEDDLLGELGRPVRKRSVSPRREETQRRDSPRRSSSPPPHIVGQIVEMGFSPAQARTALAATPSGEDVQAAIESLLGSRRSSPRAPRGFEDDHDGHGNDMEMDDERVAREMQLREQEAEERRRARHAARRRGPTRDSVRPEQGQEQQQSQRENGDDISEQADRIITQASEIGTSMLSAATSFWNTSKERAMKVYEEQRRALEVQQAQRKKAPVPTDGRPRWMVEAEEAQRAEAQGGRGSRDNGDRGPTSNGSFRDDDTPATGGFRDDLNNDPTPPRPQHRSGPAPPANPRRRPQHEETRSDLSVKERADLLFAEEERPRYVSRNRHPKGREAATPPRSAAAPTKAADPSPPAKLASRELVQASSAQVSTSAQHKIKGNEHFKLGRFTEAEAAYTAAIAALPSGHLLLVPLHNNRAAARLKLGSASDAVTDSATVIDIIGLGYHPSKEAPLSAEYADVRLGEALVKAVSKRAQAWEMSEKWRQALQDWERVLGYDTALLGASAANTKSLASEGVRRAKKMLSGDSDPKPPASVGVSSAGPTMPRARPQARPRPPAPSKPVDTDKSAAVSELRKAAAAAEAEASASAGLKDAVDAKLEAWRKGKETNIRALIASLDTVLWDDVLKGARFGMHELITEKQVKIKYMKVVARLHPDKLSAAGLTTEQKMLANGAFGTLAEAWAAFQNGGGR